MPMAGEARPLAPAFLHVRSRKDVIMRYSLIDSDKAPDPPPERNDGRAGDAEALVQFKLLNRGFNAHDARRDPPYDIVVDVVKGRSKAARGSWDFRVIRGNWRSAAGTYRR
jgi:hypothetical protein